MTQNIIHRIQSILLILSISIFFSCEQDFGDINKGYDATLKEANIPGLFNGITASLKKTGSHYRIPVAWLYQHTQLAAMFAQSGYKLESYNESPWENYYQALANSRDLEILVNRKDNPEAYTNILAKTSVLMAYKTLSTTLLYGDMPYLEAGKGFISTQHFQPEYDTQQEIIRDGLSKLSSAYQDLKEEGGQVSPGSYDVLFYNDIAMWKKFANSLRLRYAMVMQHKDPEFADPIIADALSNPLLASDEHIALDPANIPDLEINIDGYFRDNSYMRMGSTMFNMMSATDAVDGSGIYDPRCKIFFEPNENDQWVPYPQTPDANVSQVTGNPHIPDRLNNWDQNRSNFACFNVYYVNDNTMPQFILAGWQISFLKAEVYNRGLAGVTADPVKARIAYEEGIHASVNFWQKHAFNSIWDKNKPASETLTPEQLDAFINHPEVAFSGDEATALLQIYKQSWIALFHQPFEAWILQRRTGNKTPFEPVSPTNIVVDFNRITYPNSERETNLANWTKATGEGYSEKMKMWIMP